jgi:hypothetical protein
MRTWNVAPEELAIENFWFCDIDSLTVTDPDVDDHRARYVGSVQRWEFIGDACRWVARRFLHRRWCRSFPLSAL